MHHIQLKTVTGKYQTVMSSESRSYALAIYTRINYQDKRIVSQTETGRVISAAGKLVRVK